MPGRLNGMDLGTLEALANRLANAGETEDADAVRRCVQEVLDMEREIEELKGEQDG